MWKLVVMQKKTKLKQHKIHYKTLFYMYFIMNKRTQDVYKTFLEENSKTHKDILILILTING